jgi:hypothetical protein
MRPYLRHHEDGRMLHAPVHQAWIGPVLFAAGVALYALRDRIVRFVEPAMPGRWPMRMDAVFSSVFLMTLGAALSIVFLVRV